MKMLLLRYSTAFICAVFIITGAVSGEDKAVGQTVSFRPDKIVTPVSSIIWKHRSSTGSVVKAIEWDVDDGDNIPNPRFKGITTLDQKTGEITITKLTVEHSGVYTIDINSKEHEQRFTLNVMERVPKPEITIEESSNPDVVYLRCAYSEKIIWKKSSGETLNGMKNQDPGEFITVKNTRNPENFYTCTLKNAVSEEISDPVTERELFGTGEDKAVGQTVSFRPDKIVPPVSSIIWKHRSSTGSVIKVIEWDAEDGDNIPNPRFKGITTLDEKTGEITITKLTVEHSGVYTIDINGKEHEQRFTLTVMERVSKPKMTIEVSSNPDVVYLRCAYSEKIIWKNSSGETLEGKKNHELGEFITVENTGNPENFYTCTLKNAVSEEISDPVSEREIFRTGEDKGVGQTVSFRPDKIVPPVSSIIWKHRSSTGSVVKVIEWDADDGDNIPNPRFKGITTLDKKTGEITITKLTVEHSGVYTIDINSKEHEQRFTLTVMERVPKPKMTIEVSSNPDVAYLRCAYNEMIIWKNSSGETLNGTKNHDPGEYIMVKNTRNPENFYTCTLKNAVSEEISDPVTEREIFGTGSNAGMIVAIVIVVFIVIAVIAIVLSYLIMKTVHESVNNICPCIPNIFGPLDCLLKKTDREPKNSAPNDVASPLNETAP
ncbi:Down syndrome cell adhesion molecule-like protein Dscam2 isoform X4 [Cyprinus carpio]|uniref:Down syndrome cell adhesion molecule-like protein Dscam2 isoform X4 n=1 Tax=Cyprinus carpio TaxID=7962 RepID=A0A9Q9VXJ2_CYPCA|nr:Down syndrome cell adhesion molecule-like protein Dscam2 isoform X4 [Cyprinus carpio]